MRTLLFLTVVSTHFTLSELAIGFQLLEVDVLHQSNLIPSNLRHAICSYCLRGTPTDGLGVHRELPLSSPLIARSMTRSRGLLRLGAGGWNKNAGLRHSDMDSEREAGEASKGSELFRSEGAECPFDHTRLGREEFYGALNGPSPGRTWAAEAVLLASLSRAEYEETGRFARTAVSHSECPRTKNQIGEEAMSMHPIHDRQSAVSKGSQGDRVRKTCIILASNILNVIRVRIKDTTMDDGWTGLLVEVQQGSAKEGGHTEPFFSLLLPEGPLLTIPVDAAEEVQVCSLGESSTWAARHQLLSGLSSLYHVPPSIIDDEQLVMLRSMSASFGRKVLVQNLRHTVLGLSGYRALWTDILSSNAVGEGAPDVTADISRGWLVKVSAEASGFASWKWVPVDQVLPMSEYDLEVYSTYRHNLLPSSEYDLQRHDANLQKQYRKSAGLEYSDTEPFETETEQVVG